MIICTARLEVTAAAVGVALPAAVFYLEDCEQSLNKGVETGPWVLENALRSVGGSHGELSSKQLSTKESENAQEEEEEDEQRNNGLDRIDQGPQQVLQRSPIPRQMNNVA